MLVPRVQAVGCEIAGRKVIHEVIKGRDYRVVEQGRPGNRPLRVEGSVNVDRERRSQESGENHGDE